MDGRGIDVDVGAVVWEISSMTKDGVSSSAASLADCAAAAP